MESWTLAKNASPAFTTQQILEIKSVQIVANACMDFESIRSLIGMQSILLEHLPDLVHLFVVTESTMYLKNVNTPLPALLTSVLPPASAKKALKWILLLTDLPIQQQFFLAAPYVVIAKLTDILIPLQLPLCMRITLKNAITLELL